MITDEMMALAVKAYIDVDGKCRPAAMRAALSAALLVETRVKVKPLEFVDLSNRSIAHTPFGSYECGFNIAGTTNHLYHMIVAGGELAKSFHDTLEAAKAAAQADYSARILSALAVEPDHAPQTHVAVPKGYALIPLEPTDEVIEAICQEHTRCHWPGDFDRTAQAIRRQNARDGYEIAIKLAALATTEGKDNG